jgi:signal transduction histidine kinase
MATRIFPHKVLQLAFPGITKEQIHEIVSAATIRTYPENTILTREGSFETTFYIILDGEVKVSKVFNETEDRFLKKLFAGDFFGEMAIVNNAPRAATITTLCPTTVMEITKDVFALFLERHASMSLALMREVSRRLRFNDAMAIEDLRLQANELAQAYQQLAELDFARRQFLTTIAHELRTPLMAANGFMQIIRSGMLKGEALTSAVETAAHNLEEIMTLTNDILFLQEMDLILPEFKPTDAGAVVTSAVEQQRERALKSQVKLKLDLPPNLPFIKADAKSLTRALAAIIDNAIKFSPDGGEVTVSMGHEKQQVWIKVQDHGVGIPPEARPRIFDRFFHIDEVGKHLFRGVGLGLSITRQVIEQHHGSIRVQSELGEGSTFTIYLPVE